MTEPAVLLAVMRRGRRLALRRWLGSIALVGGVLVTVSTPAPYYIRTDAPVATPPSGNGATLRVRDVLVVLPPPSTSVQPLDEKETGVPWDGVPVLTLLNEGTEPVLLRTARASLVLNGSVHRDSKPVEHSIGPGEQRSVTLTLRPSRERAPAGASEGRFCLGELAFPDGTIEPIEGELMSLTSIPLIRAEDTLAPPGGWR